MEILKIQCPCGQENELVESPEGLRYNKQRHGNGELCHSKCFNCKAPLKGLEPEPTAEKQPPEQTKTDEHAGAAKSTNAKTKTSKKEK